MIISLTCVVADGSTPVGTVPPIYPRAQRIAVPRGEALTVNLVVVKQNRTAFNLTGCTIKLAVRRQLSDSSPMFTRTAVIGGTPSAGLAAVAIAEADTLGLIEKKDYQYDVQLTDGTGRRWQLVPASTFHIEPIVNRPGEEPLPPLTDPETGLPIGPAGLSVLRGEGPPDDSTGRDGESYIDDLTGDLYKKTDGEWGDPFPLKGDPGEGAPSDDDPLGLGTADPGVSTELSRSDHRHPHGDLAGGSLHAIAIAGGAAGFMSGTMAQDLATLVAADFGGQISDVAADLAAVAGDLAGVAGDLAALTTTVSGISSSLASLTSTVAGISASYVPSSRTITPGAGLVGATALDLTADRTLAVGANADGSIVVNANDVQVGVLATDAQHGNRGGGSLHADVVAGGASGFMTGAQATQLAGALTSITSHAAAIAVLQNIDLIAGAGMAGGGDLSGSNRTFNVGQHADNSITVNANDIQLSTTLQTAISTNTSNIASLTTTVGGHTTTLSALGGVKYIVQVADAAVPNAQSLGALASGLLKNTTTTGVLSIATAGTDYEVPITFTGGLDRSTNTVTIAAHGVDGTMFRQSAALSVVGNGTNALADVADITAGTDDFVLRRSGTALGFGQVATGGLADASVTAAKMFSLAGASVLGRSATGSGVMAAITGGTIGHVLTVQGDNTLAFSAPTGGGGSGYATIERPNGTPVTQRTIVSFSTAFTATDNTDTTDIGLADGGIAFAKLADGSARSILGRSANSAGAVASITGSSGQFVKDNGTTIAFAAIALADIGVGATKRIPFGNSGGTALEDDAGFTWDKSTYTLKGQGGSSPFLTMDTTNGTSVGFSGSFFRANATNSKIFTGSTVRLDVTASGNIIIGNMTETAGSAKVLLITNGTAPSGTPSGGGGLYSVSGALTWKGSSGTVTTIANA